MQIAKNNTDNNNNNINNNNNNKNDDNIKVNIGMFLLKINGRVLTAVSNTDVENEIIVISHRRQNLCSQKKQEKDANEK